MESKIKKSVSSVAAFVEGEVFGDAEKIVAGVASFETAGKSDLTLAGEPDYLKKLGETGAGVILVPASFENFEGPVSMGAAVIRVKNPRAAWARVMRLFYPPVHPKWGISPAAHTGENFTCGENCDIGPCAVIGDNVTIGDRTVVYPHVHIGDGAVLGDDVVVYSNVTIGWGSRIGSRCIFHPGAVIGSDGFGFAPDGEKWEKIPQLGIVEIDDDVEIGACVTIDRATLGKTHIGAGVKTDNQVHVAHNVTVGENSILVAKTAIAGSCNIGKHVIMAGRSNVAQRLNIGDGAVVGPLSGIAKDVPAKAVVSGAPAMPHRHFLRVTNVIAELPELKKKLLNLEKLAERIISSGGSEKD